MNERSYALNSASGEFCFFPIDRNETGLPLAWWEVGLAEVGVGARKTSQKAWSWGRHEKGNKTVVQKSLNALKVNNQTNKQETPNLHSKGSISGTWYSSSPPFAFSPQSWQVTFPCQQQAAFTSLSVFNCRSSGCLDFWGREVVLCLCQRTCLAARLSLPKGLLQIPAPASSSVSSDFQPERSSWLPGWGAVLRSGQLSCKRNNPLLKLQTLRASYRFSILPIPSSQTFFFGGGDGAEIYVTQELQFAKDRGNALLHLFRSEPASPALGRQECFERPREDQEGHRQHSRSASVQLYLHWARQLPGPGIKVGSSQSLVWNKIAATVGAAGQGTGQGQGQSYVGGELFLEDKWECGGWMLSWWGGVI